MGNHVPPHPPVKSEPEHSLSSRNEGMPFSIGAIGPRDLTGARKVLLRASISRVLRDVIEGLAPLMNLRARPGSEVTRPRLVTALTGAADLLIVEEALAAGYHLSLILPRPRAEHLSRLGPDLEARAHRAIEQATEVSEPVSLFGAGEGGFGHAEMLGTQGDFRSRLLMASDLLICVWDGEPGVEADSSGSVAISAAEQGIPVVWIASAPPHAIRLYGLSAPHPQSWNRILPPDVLERLEQLATPESEDYPTPS